MSNSITQTAAADLKERAEQIGSLQERHAELKGEAKKIADQIADLFDDAESSGFDKKALRQCIKELRLDDDQRQAQFDFEAVLDTYRHALEIVPHDGALKDGVIEQVKRLAKAHGIAAEIAAEVMP